MQKHLIFSIVLAFALAAMCAPVVHPHRRSCPRRPTKLSKPSASSTSRAHSKPQPHARSKPQPHRLGRRASDIKLCGLSLRGSSASACQGNPGFVEVVENSRGSMQWKNWGQFNPAGNECDHLVELQLIKAALESIHFCAAWDGMLKIAETEGHVEITQALKTEAFSILKSAANNLQGLHYLNKEVNGEKRDFVANVIQKRRVLTSAMPIGSNVVKYIDHLKLTGNTIAANVDAAAKNTLDELFRRLTRSHKEGTSEDDKGTYACLLDMEKEQAMPSDTITAVSTYWEYLRDSR